MRDLSLEADLRLCQFSDTTRMAACMLQLSMYHKRFSAAQILHIAVLWPTEIRHDALTATAPVLLSGVLYNHAESQSGCR